MSKKLHIRKGDTVVVVAGDSKGKTGKVLEVMLDKNRAIVESVNLVTKHTKPNAKNPKGGLLKQEMPIHVSNLMHIGSDGKPTRVGRQADHKSSKSVRVSKKTGEVIK